MRDQIRSDRGASIFMLAISLFLLIGASAVAIDIAAIWLDRSTDQKITDAAAAVGILEAVQTSSQAACETALNYVVVNTPDLDSIDTSGCAAIFNGVCQDGTPRELPPVLAGRYEITVVHPVLDNDDLMTSRIVSRAPQALVDDDGEPCERLAVKMKSTRNSLFAQVLGFSQGTTTVHTVARRIEGDDRPPLNLIVLDRTGCNAISVNGGGKIVADPVIEDGEIVPGLVIADSDGSGCSGTNGVINVSGAGSEIRADGPDGCGATNNSFTFKGFAAEEGCGRIQVLASPGIPGTCTPPACSTSGGGAQPIPTPSPLGRRYTRQPADHKYNCYSDYAWASGAPTDVSWATEALTTSNQQNIEPCEDWDSSANLGRGNDYIYNLIDEVGSSGKPDLTSYDFWQADLGHPCTVNTTIPPISGRNVVVDCNTLNINGSVTINGNVVFNGNVRVAGSLTIDPPDDKPWIFFRGGNLNKGGTGTLTFVDAMVYMARGSSVSLSGSSSGGGLSWTAPPTGSGEFADLALWSDSTATHSWSGQSSLTLRGTFFMPRAEAAYTGGGSQEQTDAQWLAWRLSVGGGANLHISPAEGGLPAISDRAELIR